MSGLLSIRNFCAPYYQKYYIISLFIGACDFFIGSLIDKYGIPINKLVIDYF